ncbi:MAG: helix-turn-helix domain-containing protein [Acidimicrobiia bacterium]|nr:helix-turn-helix domain-containing protein [Acidimicrobiia bacterium]
MLRTPAELAEQLGVPIATLSQWRWRSVGPAFVKIGRHVRYRDEEIEAWLTQQTRGGDAIDRAATS